MTEKATSDPKHTVAFQGIPGAHSDMACQRMHPYLHTMACETFQDVFTAVSDGTAAYGMIPIENSYAGRVAEIHNLLPEADVNIVSEYFHPVEHHLLGVKGTKVSDVKTVYSHHQALMQCRKFLDKHKMKHELYFDTAGAARDVAEMKDKSKAAIASALAAEHYGLEVLQKNVHDDNGNMTHFLTIAKDPVDVDVNAEHALTSMIFKVRNIPAALYKALGSFATNNVNLLKLESYVPNRNTGVAQFFITIEGHPEEKRVQIAMEELGFFSSAVKLLGTYEADKTRFVD